MQDVLWNNEMDLCIGLLTELDREQFIYEARRTHHKFTGESMPDNYELTYHKDIWRLELKI